jgi:hypothetical protein
MKDKQPSGPADEAATASGSANLPEMFDKIIGEIERNAVFPP